MDGGWQTSGRARKGRGGIGVGGGGRAEGEAGDWVTGWLGWEGQIHKMQDLGRAINDIFVVFVLYDRVYFASAYKISWWSPTERFCGVAQMPLNNIPN